MKQYAQLTQEQRYQIQAYMKAGFNQTQTANFIGVDKSTVSREVRRNRGRRGYRAQQAHRFCLERRADKAQSRIESATWHHVRRLLREDWSPEQIGLWLAKEAGLSVSHESIYLYVLADKQAGGSLYRHLRCQKQRKKRYGTYSRRGQIPNQISIDQRPAVVDSRHRYGDWELDTVIGKNHRQALVTLVERKSKLTLIAKVARKTAEAVSEAIIRLLKPLAPWVHTLTADNGREFAQHQKIARALNAKFYFAHPFASWERGLNENTNGLIRQYFPKKHDFTTITQRQIQRVMEKLNNRPRKCLGIKTPNQVFFGIHPDVALAT
ncbi:IS30 family transposase [Thiohalophilus sp.]|uniref:IS30 family transposase n=1 Tax=Thiohalophilus sp. TaxID=3028392 RepID=UPI002ACEB3F9|nr:IS30 family transposase [Thiohalophilus sp.]MDZ7802816.1 IS30 family transposase [Thiohalophilus sp.]MDZ7804944.1 IS30 family transposase [Thiohalophilus sp.]MDZ7805141.1 IS30 family transposase [Thiohalophilus sp.]